MNKQDQQELKRAYDFIEQAKAVISNLQGVLEGRFDDMSERMQESEKGEILQSDIDQLGAANDSLDDAVAALDEVEQ